MPTISLDGHRWHYHTWGSPHNPLLLLLHGFTGSSASWAELGQRWSTHHYVVAPDLPGHGQTPASANPQAISLAETARRLSLLLNHLSRDKAAVLGYSMGGRLALHMGIRNGKQISKLILESASPGLSQPLERQMRQQHDRDLAKAIESRGLEWFITYWADLPLFESQPAWLRRSENSIRASQSSFGLAQSLRGAGTGEQDSLWDALSMLHMPVFLITGALDTKFSTIAQEMTRHSPRLTWMQVENTGHNVHGERPNQFFKLVSHFLTQSGDKAKEGNSRDGI